MMFEGKRPFSPPENGRFPSNIIRTDRFEDDYDRFYYIPKADRGERDEGLDTLPKRFSATMGNGIGLREHNIKEPNAYVKNIHPTVKPIALMEHLIKLVSRENQIILDPFVGSGTTCLAARKLNRHYIGIDKDEEYCKIARLRLASIPVKIDSFLGGSNS